MSKKLVEVGYDVSTLSTRNTFYIDVKKLRNPSFAFFSALKSKSAKYDVVHAHNVPSAIPMKMTEGRKVLTIHGYYSEQMGLLHGRLVGKISSLLEPRMLRWADVVTVVSKSAQEAYRERGVNTVYIPNAIDLEGLPSGEERLYDRQIIFVGRLSKEKGVDVLVKAAEAIEGAHFLIVGSGPEEKRLKDYGKKNSIHFLGWQPWERTIRLIRGSDAFVLPSRMEGLPTVLLEAMAVGTPVIATKVGGVPEIIDDNDDGILIATDDVQSLIKATISIMNDTKLGEFLSKNAKEKVGREYSWKVILPKYLDVYDIIV